MFKILSFLLVVSIFTVAESSAMHPDDRKNQMAARLKKKLLEKDKDVVEVNDVLKRAGMAFETLIENQKLDTQIKALSANYSPIIDTQYLDKILKVLQNTQITEKQTAKIKTDLLRQNLDITQTLIMKENFLNSLKSGQKYKEQVHKLLYEEWKFHSGLSLDFPANEAFACDVLPFNHKLRKNLILRLKIVSEAGLEILPIFITQFNKQDLKNPMSLLKSYVLISGASAICLDNCANMLPQLDTQETLRIKYRRLSSSFYDGEIESFLKYYDLLFPYVKVVQDVLKIEIFDKVFTYKKILEGILDKQRQENQRGPSLLTKYKLFLQERAKKTHPSTLVKSTNINTPKPTNVASSSEKQMSSEESPEEFTGDIQSPVNTNEKSNYRGPSEQEKTAERKRQAKEQKKVKAATSPSKEPEPKSSSQKESKQSEKIDFFIEIGGGPFKIFNKVMDQSFKGTIEKIILLIEALGGSVDDGRSGSRIKIELPYINSNKKAYLDILPPEEEEESETPQTVNTTTTTTTTTSTTSTTAESVMHTPHKGKSKKLRFYHTKDVRALLIDAGYTLDVVRKGSQFDQVDTF